MVSEATEQEILQELVSAWVSLGLEYSAGAPDVTAMYVYVSSEHGYIFANIYFEQRGIVVFPDDLEGVVNSTERVHHLHKLQFDDLKQAQAEFTAAEIPAPTEYKIYYEPQTRKLDVVKPLDVV